MIIFLFKLLRNAKNFLYNPDFFLILSPTREFLTREFLEIISFEQKHFTGNQNFHLLMLICVSSYLKP